MFLSESIFLVKIKDAVDKQTVQILLGIPLILHENDYDHLRLYVLNFGPAQTWLFIEDLSFGRITIRNVIWMTCQIKMKVTTCSLDDKSRVFNYRI